jgi:predicted HNH restriction endonuclease
MKGRWLLAKQETRRYADRRQYLIKAVHKRRKKIRQMAVDYKGGCCEVCGYNRCMDALEFHHSNSSGKDFSISDKGYTRSWTKVQEDLDKCILLCANCHREIHAQTKAQLSQEIGIEKSGEFREA